MLEQREPDAGATRPSASPRERTMPEQRKHGESAIATPRSTYPRAAEMPPLAARSEPVSEVRATSVTLERSRARWVSGDTVRLRQSGAALVLGRDVQLVQAGGAIVAGAKLAAQQAGAQWLVGGLVQAKQVVALAVLAGKVEGQVRCLFDARGAFAFGAGLALMSTLLRLLVRRR
jgi:hypothetical protein